MKVMLLAAGRGTRIKNNIGDVPKCTLSLGETSLIEHTIKLFMKNKIDIEIVLGYKCDVIIEILKKYNVSFELNPFYSLTNSLASFWFLFEKWGDEDIIIMNADVFIEQDTLDSILDEQKSPVLFVDSSDVRKGDYFVKHSHKKTLLSYGKDLPFSERTAEYIGVAKIANKDKKDISEKLDKMMRDKRFNCWWEDILYNLSDEGKSVFINDVKGNFWGEIDTIQDYHRLNRWIIESNERGSENG